MTIQSYSEARSDLELRMARNDAVAIAEMASLGVTFGEPVTQHSSFGCGSCRWHAVNLVEKHEDGGTASAILSWIKDGHLGKPENIKLHPVQHNPTTA